MSITVQFLQQSQAAEQTQETVPSGPCGLKKFERASAQLHRPKRIRACVPPPKPAPAASSQAMISAYVPYPGRSVLHKRIHANNIAAIGQMAAQQQQAFELKQQVVAMQQQLLAQQEIAWATGVIAKSRPPNQGPDAIDPRLNDLKYSLIADVVAVAAHLMDKHAVTSDSFLNDKLELNTAPLIEEVVEKLIGFKLDSANEAFSKATDSAMFAEFVSKGDMNSRGVFDEINLRAGYLLMTMIAIAAAPIEGYAGDWPAPTDVIDVQTGPATGPAPGTPPAQAAVARAAAKATAKQAAPRIGTKRAKKIAGPRSKR